MWRTITPSVIYLTSDGATPIRTPLISTNWYGTSAYYNGMEQETCRDLNHTMLGLAGMVHAAETARIQGVDLWGEQKT